MAKDDLNYDQAVDALKKLPEDKLRLALGKLNPDALKAVRQRLESPQIDFTNTIDPRTGKGYGLYKMTLNGTDFTDVPYNKVEDAAKAGYLMHPDVRETYAKDRFATLQPPSGKTPVRGSSVANPLEGRFTKGGNIVSQPPLPQETPAPSPGLWEKMRTAFTNAAVPTGANRPTSLSKTHSLLNTTWNAGANTVDEMGNVLGTAANTVFGAADMIPQIYSASKDFLTSYDPVKATNGAARLIQMLPPEMAKQYMEKLKEEQAKNPKYAADDVIGTAIGMWATGKATEKVVHPVETMKGIVKPVVRSAAEHFTGTTSREIPKMAEKAVAENKTSAEEHRPKSADAAHETRGREAEYQRQLNETERKAQEEHQKNVQETEAANQKTMEKAREAHTKEVQKIREKNLRTNAKHAEEMKRIEKENKAAEQMLDLRRAEEQQLQSETDIYYALEDAEKLKAKDTENAAWKPWHDKMDDLPVDGGTIQQKLEPILSISPEATRAIRQLVPDPSDADNLSDYGKERFRVMESNGYPKGTNYFDLPPEKRLDIDKMVASSGITPDPIDFDPKAGTAIPVKVLHRVQSILGRNIAAGRYEGVLLGEMKKVQSVLRQELTDVSVANGTDKLLNTARAATREYQEAFGRERPSPKTLDQIREKGANPDEYKEREEEKRLAGAAKLSPNLEEANKQVKARREALRKLPTEEQLRKQRQQIPQPPTIGDLRPGYTLEQEPSYEPPTVGDLRPGHALKESPQPPEGGFRAHAERTVNQPPRNLGPDRPQDKTISNEDISTEKQGNVKRTADELRRMGLRRAMYTTLTSVPFSLAMAFGHFGEAAPVEALAGGVLGGAAVFVGTNIIADLLDRPDVRSWIGNVTEKDAQAWSKLPPDQKALFTGDMQSVVNVADSKKVPVSPYIRAFVAGGAAAASKQNQPQQTLDQVKQQGQELQNQPSAPAPPPAPPGPESAIPLDNLKKIIEQAQELRSKTGNQPGYSHIYDAQSGSIIPA